MANKYSHLDIRERAVIEMHLALGTRPGAIAVFLSLRPFHDHPRAGTAMAGGALRICRGRAGRCQREATAASRPIGGQANWPGFRASRAGSSQARRFGP